MDISLCMVVKNEISCIERTLRQAVKIADEIIIVDTGSADGTPDFIYDRFGVRPLFLSPDPLDPTCIVPARNFALKFATKSWVLVLDADEELSDGSILAIKRGALERGAGAHGYFGVWRNSRGILEFDDYKLFFYRNGLGMTYDGQVHAGPQPFFRRNKLYATWMDELHVTHLHSGVRQHRETYVTQMQAAIAEGENLVRYAWFMGNSLLSQGKIESGKRFLRSAAESFSVEFPVECLNASLTLTQHALQGGQFEEADYWLGKAVSFYEEVEGDFEVVVNQFPIWFAQIASAIEQRDLSTYVTRFHAF